MSHAEPLLTSEQHRALITSSSIQQANPSQDSSQARSLSARARTSSDAQGIGYGHMRLPDSRVNFAGPTGGSVDLGGRVKSTLGKHMADQVVKNVGVHPVAAIMYKAGFDLVSGIEDRWDLMRKFLKWCLLVLPMGMMVGVACALFLWLLDEATVLRFDHAWLLFLLPIGGVAVDLLYKYSSPPGKTLNTDLLFKEITGEKQPDVPAQMAILVLIGTIVTHVFGGSVGREGTALQMAGGLASLYIAFLPRLKALILFNLERETAQSLFTASLAAGFGGVFGTPFAGAIFAMEVLSGSSAYLSDIIPCLLSAISADITCSAMLDNIGFMEHARHIKYVVKWEADEVDFSLEFNCKILGAALCFGLASSLFVFLTHLVKQFASLPVFKSYPWKAIPLMASALIMIGCVYIVDVASPEHGRDYIGLGVHPLYNNSVTLPSVFHMDNVNCTAYSWLLKLIFTALCVGAGYKGGEVTPLFFIGATLGHALAVAMDETDHVDVFAAVGFVGVFAGATNTPLACTIMGIELFGGDQTLLIAEVCFIAYVIGGQASIYGVQELKHKVKDVDVDVNVTTFHLVDERDTIGSRDPSFNTLMPTSLG